MIIAIFKEYGIIKTHYIKETSFFWQRQIIKYIERNKIEVDYLEREKEKVAVVIPFYHSELTKYEEISLQNCLKVLGSYPIIILLPQCLSEKKFESYSNVRYEIVPDLWLESIESYNQMMVSKEFYIRFTQYEYILVFQLDAFVFTDLLGQFCDMKYDYIGAPWINGIKDLSTEEKGVYFVGNGGFSLRRISAFIHILNEEAISHIDVHEDFFWSKHDSIQFRVAPVEVALKFSFEKNVRKCFMLSGYTIPFGCHAWEKYDFEFWKPIFESMGYSINLELIQDLDKKYIDEIDYHYLDSTEELIDRCINILQHKGNQNIICIFGAGYVGKECCWLLQKSKTKNIIIVDNNNHLYGKTLWDKKIVSPKILQELKNDVFIIIAVKEVKQEILVQVEKYGYRYGENVIFYEELVEILDDHLYPNKMIRKDKQA